MIRHKAVLVITTSEGNERNFRDNIYLFPRMLDQYQIQLTRMLEAEQYEETKQLLRFLLQCQGQDPIHYSEWVNLLDWLEIAFPVYNKQGKQIRTLKNTDEAFPTGGNGKTDILLDKESLLNSSSRASEMVYDELSWLRDLAGYVGEADDEAKDEEQLREEMLRNEPLDEEYMKQIIYIIQNHPMLEQQLLALERAVYMDSQSLDKQLIEWLEGGNVHPVVQFKALQCLKRRGNKGQLTIERLGNEVALLIEDTPLALQDYPKPIEAILKLAETTMEQDDPTLPYFAKEFWRDCMQLLYGTVPYYRMADEQASAVACYAAALHAMLCLTVYGQMDDEDIRSKYGIGDEDRFTYEQALRTIRQAAVLLSNENDEHQP